MSAEKGESSSDDAPVKAPVSFFDPALKETRKRVYLQWARTGTNCMAVGQGIKDRR